MKAKHESKLIAAPKIETLDPQPGELFWTRGGKETWNKPRVALIVTRSKTKASYIVFNYYEYTAEKWSPMGLGSMFCVECPTVKRNPRPQSWFLIRRLSDEDAATFRRGEKIEVTPRFFIEQKQA